MSTTKKAAAEAAPTEDTITLTKAQVAEMIADALRARDEDIPTGPPPGMELAKAIGDAVAEGMARNDTKKVTYGAYLKRPTANHPLGLLSPKFSRLYFQNGILVPYDSVNDEAVKHLNSFTHSGRYLDRKVEVIVRDNGGDAQSVEIRYKNASVDDRMDLKGLFRNFNDLVKQIADAQEAERREDEEHPKKIVKRTFGNNAATRAAEDAAGA